MAVLKAAVFLCVTVVFYTNAHFLELEERNSYMKVKDAESDALELLKELDQTIRLSVASAIQQINGLLEILDNTKKAVLEDAEETLGDEIKPFIDAIRELQDAAKEADVDISECVGNSTEEITALPLKYFNTVSSCVDRRVAAAKEYVNQTIVDMKSTLNIVTDLESQIYICGNRSSAEQSTCFEEITANITESMTDISLQIYRDVGYSQVYIYSAVPQIAMCEIGVVDDIDDEVTAIVANVTECALEKFNGTTVIPPIGKK